MAAVISFFASNGITINNMAGSGLGFYGPGNFGSSVEVGAFQDNTYITDATGAIQGPKGTNVKWVHPFSGQLPTGDTHLLRDIPNYLATLNVRFTNDVAVKTQNTVVRIFDRVDTNAPASGVTCMVAECIHPWTTMQPTGPLGSGGAQWSNLGGSGGVINGVTYDAPLALSSSPGTSGFSPSGVNTQDTQHDYYLLVSASPDAIGSQTQFGLYFSTEYL